MVVRSDCIEDLLFFVLMMGLERSVGGYIYSRDEVLEIS
jgi:hypothetical protein